MKMKQVIKDRQSQMSKYHKNKNYLDGMGHSRQRDGLGSRNAYINLTADASQKNQNLSHKDRYSGVIFKNNKVNTRRRNLKMYQMRYWYTKYY